MRKAKKMPRVIRKGESPGKAGRMELKGKGKTLDVTGLKMKRRPKAIKIAKWDVK